MNPRWRETIINNSLQVSYKSGGVDLDLLVPGHGELVLHHPPPQPEPLLVQLLVVRWDVTEPDIAREQDLQVPVLVEGDQVTDISGHQSVS